MTADSLQKEIDIEKLEKDRELVRHERRQVEPLVLQTIPIHYASAAKLQPILQDLLTSLDKFQTTGDETLANRVNRRRGSVAVDEENNALVINALRDDILKMIEVITALDKPKYQVLIEAKIIVANRQTARELGFQWGGLYKGGNSYIFPGSSSGVAGTGLGTAISPVLGNISNFPSSNFTSTTTSSTGTGTGTGTTDTGTGTDSTSTAGTTGLNLGYAYQNLGDLILTAQLTALESEGKAQIIATPSISTLDNEEATLKSGFEIPYQSYSANEGSDVQFKEALLQLTVTPHVIDGQMVKIRLTASNDEPDYSRVDSGITAEPAISRRTAETSLLLFNGETTVIGGLSRTYGSDAISGVPVLKDIPGLGKLFRSKAREKRQEDMLIFITPYILGEPTAPTAAKAASQPAQGNAAPEAKTGAAKDVPEAAKP
jgi:type IV pilus assembly protein PilQ